MPYRTATEAGDLGPIRAACNMTDLWLELVTNSVRSAPWLTVAWIAAIGGCIGSFLNVVIYRLPAGKSLVYPGSRCPKCEHTIRARDNVPILSWLALRGRCRDCGAPIAVRYPLVEATVAAMFALLWWINVQSSVPPLDQPSEATPYLLAFLLQAGLFCSLLAGALIDRDGQRVPWSLGWPLGVFALAVGFAYPEAIVARWPRETAGWLRTEPRLVIDATIAALLAVVSRGILRRPQQWSTPILLGASCGLVWGGAAAGLLVILAAILRIGLYGRAPWATWPVLLTCVAGAFPLVWNSIAPERIPDPVSWWIWATLAAASLGLGWWARRNGESAS